MRNYLLILIMLLVSGCYLPRYTSYSIDYKKGTFLVVYHDIRTDATADSAIIDDWNLLKHMANSKDTSFDTNIVKLVSQQLFQEDSVLSGKRKYSISCTRCFPSKSALLKLLVLPLDGDDFQWADLNKDIVLSVPKAMKVKSSNGKMMNTANATLVTWPDTASAFEITFGPDSFDVPTSLLPRFLESQPAKDAKKKRGK
jgi:hypothetical protein